MRNKKTPGLEVIAFACFIMGMALYIAVDTGVINLTALKANSSDSSSIPDLSPRVARLKALHQKIEQVEARIKERVETLQQVDEQLGTLAEKLNGEKASLAAIDQSMVDVEKERKALEIARPSARAMASAGAFNLGSNVSRIAIEIPKAYAGVVKAAQKLGVTEQNIDLIKHEGREYLRFANTFDFQPSGIYLRSRGMEKAQGIVEAALDGNIDQLTVVFHSSDERGDIGRERAYVLRNYIKEVTGDDLEVKVSRVLADQGLKLEPGAVELWMGQ